MNNYITDIEELELWKPVTIEGYEHYWVSNQGRVMNSRTGCFLKPGLSQNKYLCVQLHNNGNNLSVTVHRLVGLAWIPNPDNKRTINHIDGIKTNNKVENLEWATHQENMQHAFETGLINYRRDKLLAEKVKIKGMLLKGLNYKEIAKVYDCGTNTIRMFVIDNNLRESKKYASKITNELILESYNLLSEGNSLNNIGRSLGYNPATIRTHLNKLYGKDHVEEVMSKYRKIPKRVLK